MGLTHLDGTGRATMVDVSAKAVTERRAVVKGRLLLSAKTLELVVDGKVPKGDVLAVARIAGIQAAKRTSELIPLCHALPLEAVKIEIEPEMEPPALVVTAEAKTFARTGVEMEAFCAAAVSLLTLYDMLKAVDRGMTVTGLRLEYKAGGSSGTWTRELPLDGSAATRAVTSVRPASENNEDGQTEQQEE